MIHIHQCMTVSWGVLATHHPPHPPTTPPTTDRHVCSKSKSHSGKENTWIMFGASVFVHNADAKADSQSSQHAAYSCTCGCYLGIHKLRLAVCFQRVSSAIGCRAPSNKSSPSACSDSLECGPASHENTHFSREKGAPDAQKNQICYPRWKKKSRITHNNFN